MRIIVLLILLFIIYVPPVFCQVPYDTLVIRRINQPGSLYMFNKEDPREKSLLREARHNGFFVYQGGEKLSWSQVVVRMRSNKLANDKIKTAQNTFQFRVAFEWVFNAGIFVYCIFSTAEGSYYNSTKESVKQLCILFGSLIGGIIISEIIGSAAYKPTKAAIDIYNGDLKKNSRLPVTDVNLDLTQNGYGLVIRF